MPPDETLHIASRQPLGRTAQSHSVVMPEPQTVPFVFASPHSGADYPPSFLASSRLDATALRRSEDAFIDELFFAAADYGAPLLRAHFPRAFVDPNREPFELDPAMFDGPLPGYCRVDTPRVVAGLGTIARVVTNGAEIYRRRLRFDEAKDRIERHYMPYHASLRRLIDSTVARFGTCILIDCHSMPSIGGPMDSDMGLRRVDSVLGDRFGSSCASALTTAAADVLESNGLSVRRNVPYAGGYTTGHYGDPRNGVHALQIEINRALYMDEDNVQAIKTFTDIQDRLRHVIAALTALDVRSLTS